MTLCYDAALQVFDIGKGNNTPITGLEFHRVPGSEKYFVLVTTPNRLYQFIGYVTNSDEKPLLQQVFNSYLTVPGNNRIVICVNTISGGTRVLNLRQTFMICNSFMAHFQCRLSKIFLPVCHFCPCVCLSAYL